VCLFLISFGLKSIQREPRDHNAFQSGVSAQLDGLEDRMNLIVVGLECVQNGTNGIGYLTLKLGSY